MSADNMPVKPKKDDNNPQIGVECPLVIGGLQLRRYPDGTAPPVSWGTLIPPVSAAQKAELRANRKRDRQNRRLGRNNVR